MTGRLRRLLATGRPAQFGARLRRGHRGPADYPPALVRGGKALLAEDRRYLVSLGGPLAETADAVARAGTAAFQEQLVEVLRREVAAGRQE